MTEEQFAVKRFHRLRVPFFIRSDGFIYVTRNYHGSHEEWARQLGLPEEAMESWARGYYWPPSNDLFFYVGMYTTDYEWVENQVRNNILELIAKVAGNEHTIIHGGMKPGEYGTVWPSVRNFGNIEQFRVIQ